MASKRVHDTADGPFRIEDFEEDVDAKVADIVQKILHRLQSERNRIVEAAYAAVEPFSPANEKDSSDCKVSFTLGEEFENAVTSLLQAPLGPIEVMGAKVRKVEVDEKIVNEIPTPTPSIDTSIDAKSTTAANSVIDSPLLGPPYEFTADAYKRMRMVASIAGRDQLGDVIEKPHSIIRLPDSDCLAFLHNENHISLVSSAAKIIATFQLQVKFRPHAEFLMRPWDLGGLAADGATNELFFLDTFSRIMKIKPSCASSRAARLVPSICKTLSGPGRSLAGLGVAGKPRLFYTAFAQEIVGYSLEDWSPRAEYCTKKLGEMPTVCTVSETASGGSHVYFKFEDEKKLYRIAFDQDGKLDKDGATCFGEGFKKLRGVAVDPMENVLVVDNGRRRIEVLSPQGASICSIGPESHSKASFYPSGVAVLEPSPGTKGLPMVAVTDYYADCVLFFAPKDV